MAKVAMVEDHMMTAEGVMDVLTRRCGHEVTLFNHPSKLHTQDATFDAALVDLLFRVPDADAALEFDTGITALRFFSDRGTPTILWTSGEANRSLHLSAAFSLFDIRGAIPKDPPLAELIECLTDVLAGKRWIHPQLRPYETLHKERSAGEKLLASAKHRSIWKALAAGASSHGEVARATNYAQYTIREAVGEMNQLLAHSSLLAQSADSGRPLINVSAFARLHREFFLDHTLIEVIAERSGNS